MRRVTRNAVLGIVVVLVLLLALGALPSLLGSGDPYYVTATPVDGSDVAAGGNASESAVNGSTLSERRFPYTTAALETGRSDPYRKGPVGFKGAFTHSPFDEVRTLEGRYGSAVTDRGVLVADNGTLYSVAVGQPP